MMARPTGTHQPMCWNQGLQQPECQSQRLHQPSCMSPLEPTAASALLGADPFQMNRLFFLELHLLPLKSENLSGCRADGCTTQRCSYNVCWEHVLGSGTYGKVYAGGVAGRPSNNVAINIFHTEQRKEGSHRADAEVKRHAAI